MLKAIEDPGRRNSEISGVKYPAVMHPLATCIARINQGNLLGSFLSDKIDPKSPARNNPTSIPYFFKSLIVVYNGQDG